MLVVAQVALSLVVLVGAGLCLRSLQKLRAVDPGFDAARILVVSADLSLSGYDDVRGLQFCSDLIERVRLLRGVEAVSVAMQLPLAEGISTPMKLDGYEPKPGEDMTFDYNLVGPDYFGTMKIPLVDGREFRESDTSAVPDVLIINETAARRFWSGRSPLGRRMTFRSSRTGDIIGIVKDSKYRRLSDEARPAVYRPFAQQYVSIMSLHVRTTGKPDAMLNAVRREVQTLDPSLPLYNVKTLEEQKSSSLYTSRMAATLLTVFGLLGLVLAAVGLYGVMAYAVNRRRREIGIRLSLGARSRDVLGQVIGEGMTIVTVGLSLGLAGAISATRLVRSLLYGVTPTDPLTFGAAVLLLAAVALLANYLPARQASRTDPILALKCD
jgi:predicted permease